MMDDETNSCRSTFHKADLYIYGTFYNILHKESARIVWISTVPYNSLNSIVFSIPQSIVGNNLRKPKNYRLNNIRNTTAIFFFIVLK